MQNHDLRIIYTILEKEKQEDELANYKVPDFNEWCFVTYVIKKLYITSASITSERFELEASRLPELKDS